MNLNEAKKILVKGKSEAEGVSEQVRALSGRGGENIVKLEIGKELSNSPAKFISLGTNQGNNNLSLEKIDANELVKMLGVVEAAKDEILNIVKGGGRDFKKGGKRDFKKDVKFEIGEEFDGVVQKVAEFGAFISLKDGVDGLLHISKIKTKLHEGDSVKVKVAEQKGSKISLVLAD